MKKLLLKDRLPVEIINHLINVNQLDNSDFFVADEIENSRGTLYLKLDNDDIIIIPQTAEPSCVPDDGLEIWDNKLDDWRAVSWQELKKNPNIDINI